MNKYKADFYGRKLHAIGVCYNATDTCQGNNEHEALLELYNRWDSVHLNKPLELIPEEVS